jgi:hypothetical protein
MLIDLKSYFSQSCNGPCTHQTHGSAIVPRVVEEEVADSGEEVAQVQEKNCEETQVQEEGITMFNLDHIISDLGL